MSSGYIRFGEEKNVMLETPAWLMVVAWTGKTFKEETIHFNKTEMKGIISRLRKLRKNERYYVVWPGEWNTDVFQVDPIIIADRLVKETDPKYLK